MYTRKNHHPPELGGVTGFESIVDLQEGPTCGFEAIETVIQLFGRGNNDLTNTHLLPMAASHGVLYRDSEGFSLDASGYQPLLAQFRIGTNWYDFDHRVLISALKENRVAVVVLDAHEIDRSTYPQVGSWHALVITSYIVDQVSGRIVSYVGADSNYPSQERFWSVGAVERATRSLNHSPLLITDSPATWRSTTDFYVRRSDRKLVPMRRAASVAPRWLGT